jgi:hypothetical protein
MKGESIGAIAKRYKMDKGQVRRIISRVVEHRNELGEVLHAVPPEEASEGRELQSL